MAGLEERSRMVNIRFSGADFKALKAICLSTGARSVSDLAHDAIGAMIARTHGRSHANPAKLRARMDALGQRVSALQAQVSWLASVIGVNRN